MADQTGSMTGIWDGEKIHRSLPRRFFSADADYVPVDRRLGHYCI